LTLNKVLRGYCCIKFFGSKSCPSLLFKTHSLNSPLYAQNFVSETRFQLPKLASVIKLTVSLDALLTFVHVDVVLSKHVFKEVEPMQGTLATRPEDMILCQPQFPEVCQCCLLLEELDSCPQQLLKEVPRMGNPPEEAEPRGIS